MRIVKKIKFGSLTRYKGYEYQIYLVVDPIKDMLKYKSWFQVEIEKGLKVWAITLDKDQTIDDGQNKVLDYIDKLVRDAEKVA